MAPKTVQRGSQIERPAVGEAGRARPGPGGVAALKEGAVAAGRARSAEDYLADVVDQLARLVGSEMCSILLLERNHLWHAAAVGLPPEYLEAVDGVEIGPAVGSCGAAAVTARTVVSADIETDPRWRDYVDLARAANLRACWSVPLKLPDGTVLGTFATYFAEPRQPSTEEIELSEAYASIVALGLDSVRRKGELAASYEAAVLALTSALDVRDDYTGSHSTATSRLVRQVCIRLGLDQSEIDVAARVAALHDVGKLGVPTEILTSATPLSAEQTRVMRDHPVIGEQILRQIPGMDEVATAVRHAHERWEGGGYPDGLAGDRIPLASRIVFVCDAYHAMVSDRPYRSGLDQAEAISELNANAGSQFDPEVVAALLHLLGDEAAMLGCSPSEVEEHDRRDALERLADEIGAEDVFVFRKVAPDTYSHLAGAGRGDGWAGNIELRSAEAGLLESLTSGRPRWFNGPKPTRIIGPYYARSAVVVPCRRDVVVVFGSSSDSLGDAGEHEVLEYADRVARLADHVPAAKRLADELEVLDAIRAVTTVHADEVEVALAEISERAARALSCEFAAVVVDGAPVERFGWHEAGWVPGPDPAATRELLAAAAAFTRESAGPILVQDTAESGSEPPPGFAAADGAASVHAVSIDDLAVLITVHAQPNPRGFTGLCQRVAASLADGAGVVVRRALAQEQLSRENASLELRARTDPLTGVSNRGGWEAQLVPAQLALSSGELSAAVALFDLDELKQVNDGYGHLAGDELLQRFGRVLGETARASDFVARIGGDEFAVLLRDCDLEGASAWCERVIAAVEAEEAIGERPALRVSWGCAATTAGGSIAAAFADADRSLYGDKGANPGRIEAP